MRHAWKQVTSFGAARTSLNGRGAMTKVIAGGLVTIAVLLPVAGSYLTTFWEKRISSTDYACATALKMCDTKLKRRFHGLQNLVVAILTIPLCSFVASSQAVPAATDGARATALLIEKQKGERRVHRSAGTTIGTAPFVLNFDPLNAGTKHLVMFTEELPRARPFPDTKSRFRRNSYSAAG